MLVDGLGSAGPIPFIVVSNSDGWRTLSRPATAPGQQREEDPPLKQPRDEDGRGNCCGGLAARYGKGQTRCAGGPLGPLA